MSVIPVVKFLLLLCKNHACFIHRRLHLGRECVNFKTVYIIERDIRERSRRRFNIPGNRQINQNHMPRNLCFLQKLPRQCKIRACRRADCQIALWQKFHSVSVMNPSAALRDAHHTASVLPDRYGNIRPCFFKCKSRHLSHFPVSNYHTGFPFQMKSLIFQAGQRLMDHRNVSSGKNYFCFHSLCRRYCHTEQHLQHIIGTIGFSGKRQGVLHLGNDLILRQNLRFQPAGEIKKMLHRLFSGPLYKILPEIRRIFLFFPAKELIQGTLPFLLRAHPDFHPVTGRQNNTSQDALFFSQAFHRCCCILFRKRKSCPDIHGSPVVVNSNHGNTHRFQSPISFVSSSARPYIYLRTDFAFFILA